jgi:hypothetical protein
MSNQEQLPREEVYDTPEPTPATQRPGWDLTRTVLVILGVLMLLFGLLWVAELVGLLAAALPGIDLDAMGGAGWGFVGLLGLVLLLWALFRK